MRAVIEAGVVLLIIWLFLRVEEGGGLGLSATAGNAPCGGSLFSENPGDSSGAWEGSCLPSFGSPVGGVGGPGGAGAGGSCCCGGGGISASVPSGSPTPPLSSFGERIVQTSPGVFVNLSSGETTGTSYTALGGGAGLPANLG